MYRVLCCLVVASLTIQICCAGASNKTEKGKGVFFMKNIFFFFAK